MSSRRGAKPARKNAAAVTRRPAPVRKPVSRTPVWVMPAAVVAGLALVIATFLVIRWYLTPPAPTPLPADTTAAVVSQITSIPASNFEQIGQGGANNLIQPVSGTPLTGATGKPEVLYIGAEYCPYCAAERWAIIVALSRFGTWSGLKTTSSSSTDVYANTPTFTFHGATYTSQYIDFRGVETSDRNQKALETPTSAEQQIMGKYNPQGSIPFVIFANRYSFNGATYSPDLLGGKDWQQVADAISDPSTTQARAIIGSANLITAAICRTTSDQPAEVCSSQMIQGLEKKLG
jgi:thiol-disulfide isomerase/thioredoxin